MPKKPQPKETYIYYKVGDRASEVKFKPVKRHQYKVWLGLWWLWPRTPYCVEIPKYELRDNSLWREDVDLRELLWETTNHRSRMEFTTIGATQFGVNIGSHDELKVYFSHKSDAVMFRLRMP